MVPDTPPKKKKMIIMGDDKSAPQYLKRVTSIFVSQTYVNVQYPISMYKVDIHCTNLLECPIYNI